jgi:hypothetical protein
VPAADAPTRGCRRANTEAAGARERPLSGVGAKKGEKNIKQVKKDRREQQLEELPILFSIQKISNRGIKHRLLSLD